jgi:hypothetical protein
MSHKKGGMSHKSSGGAKKKPSKKKPSKKKKASKKKVSKKK